MLKVFYCCYIVIVHFKKNIRINVPKMEKGKIMKITSQSSLKKELKTMQTCHRNREP